MFKNFPTEAAAALDWDWNHYKPFARQLTEADLNAGTIDEWMAGWTQLTALLHEVYARLVVATRANTSDATAQKRLHAFLDGVYPHAETTAFELGRKLIAAGLTPDGLDVPMRSIRADVERYREENLPLLAQHQKLALEYDQIIGGQTVTWEGEEVTLVQLANRGLVKDRAVREKAWRLASKRVLEDRAAINDVWVRLMDLRGQIAENAGMDSYRDYAWSERHRFDYSPDDCETFHAAIEEVVVPAAARVYERRRQMLGVDVLRPWDLSANAMRATDMTVEIYGDETLVPFVDGDELAAVAASIFERVDPAVGRHFGVMRDDGLMDLENRKGKGPGAFCIGYPLMRKPFIYVNATSGHDDLQTMLHECGHAFHAFEAMRLPYAPQWRAPMEFNEVASMAMELLAAPYFEKDQGGPYTEEEAARARLQHLEGLITFWPYMAVVDAFQHWVYTHHTEASNPANCDAKWAECWDRFMVGVDYSGLDAERHTGWHRKLHLYHHPFYYVEYGLAQLGAVQVWRNALDDQAGAVESYLTALKLGGTAPLPTLYDTAGADFAFDADTLGGAVDLIETTMDRLSAAL